MTQADVTLPSGGPMIPPPPPGMIPGMTPPPGMPMPDPTGMTVDQVDRMVAQTAAPPPTMPDESWFKVELPAGYLTPEGLLVSEAFVRELNGYDEEKLARIDAGKNPSIYVTEMLGMGVESLGGEKPSKDVLRKLLIGDREALVLGVRQATYGNEVKFKLECPNCENASEVTVFIDEDVKTIKLEDPVIREFEVPLRNNGTAKVRLLDGFAQEAFSEGLGKKTQAEINTIMLAKSVIAINGTPVMSREDDVKRLSTADRSTIIDFIAEKQPGPQLQQAIEVPCSVCSEKYQVFLGMGNLFRF